MKIAPARAARNRKGWNTCANPASAVPTSTGATAAGRVLEVGRAALRGLVRHVKEQVRIVRELLDAGETVLVGVEARLQQPQREGGEREHLAAPLDRLGFQL